MTLKTPATAEVKLKEPVLALIDAPAGASGSRLKLRVFAGRSWSLAVAVNVMGVPAVPVWSPTAARTGASLTS